MHFFLFPCRALLRGGALAALLLAAAPGTAAGQPATVGQAITAAEAAELERLLGVPFAEIAGLGLSAGVLRSLLGRLAEEVSVGTRGRPRAPAESADTVALIGGAALSSAVVGGDLADALRTLSTAVSASPAVAGGSAARPVRLRGLGSGHVVVLVDGIRRHRSAVVDSLGDPSDFGAQGPDVAGIPRIAVRQVELLLGGASAQYGSEAVAGVIDFVLKDARQGGVLEIRSGIHGHPNAGSVGGPGIEPWSPLPGSMSPAYSVAGNVGLPVGSSGFANLSFERGSRAPTNRAVQRADAAALVEAGNPSVRDTAQIWGTPAVGDDLKLFGNFGGPVAGAVVWFARAGYSSREVAGGLGFRNPHEAPGVFLGPLVDGVSTLLVARREPGVTCPLVSVVDGLVDHAALAAVARHPDCFSFATVLPGGFAPEVAARVADVSLAGGLRGVLADGRMRWDAWAAYGSSDVDLSLTGSVNPSLGMAAGEDGLDRVGTSSFRPGAVRQTEVSAGVGAAWTPAEFVDVGVGVEARAESFGVRAGGAPSWTAGPYAGQGFAAGALGLAGYRPAEEGVSRVFGGASYVELGVADPGSRDRWRVSSAARLDGSPAIGKVVSQSLRARWVLRNEGGSSTAVRGGLSTGFTAPTPAQLRVAGVVPAHDREVGRFVYAAPSSVSLAGETPRDRKLDPETSLSASLGVVLDTRRVLLALDHFRVAISDRVTLGPPSPRSPPGIGGRGVVGSERTFVNGFGTSTVGVHLGAVLRPAGPAGAHRVELGYTRAATSVAEVDVGLLRLDTVAAIERALPRDRWRMAWIRTAPRLDLMVAASWFGPYRDAADAALSAAPAAYPTYAGRVVVDVEAGFPLAGVRLVAGVRNLAAALPAESPDPALVGRLYGGFSPFGFNGSFWYSGIDFAWGPR